MRRLWDLVIILGVIALACSGWWWHRRTPDPIVGSWRVEEQQKLFVTFSSQGEMLVHNGKQQLEGRGTYRVDWSNRPAHLDIEVVRDGRSPETYRMLCEITPKGQLRVQEGYPKEQRPTQLSQKATLLTRVSEVGKPL